MKSCTRAPLESPIEASRPSFHDIDEPKEGTAAPRRLVRKPSKLQTTIEVTRCRFGNTSRQAAPIGFEEFVPQKDWTPIAHAVFHDRKGALHHFLQSTIPPDDAEEIGIPLLAIATACGHLEIASVLLEAGAHVNASSKYKGETALHVAVKGGRHDIIDLLLEHRADLEARTRTGATPLHYAAVGPGSLALVTKLLKFGAHHDVKDAEGRTPAAAALQVNNLHAAVAIINMVRGKPKQLVKEKELLLQRVEKTADRASVTNDLIVDVFAATCHPDSTVLVEAIKKNDARLVEMFLEKGADPHRTTAEGLLPIFVAVKFADLRIVRMLVQRGADVTVRGPGNLEVLQVLFKTFSVHSEDSIVSTVDYLLAKGANGLALYSDNKTLLHLSVNASTDRANVVKLLLKNGIDINAQDDDGNTALHLAAHNGLINAARAMLDAHADTTIVDAAKRTPLLRAVLKQQWSAVRMLAVLPAMTSWDVEGSTALHYIAQCIPRDENTWGDVATAAKPFCERGVCRSMRDPSGATPLIQAIKTLPEEGVAVVQALLAEGDQRWNCIGHEDHKRRDALHYAVTLGKPVFVKILLEFGAPLDLEEWTEGKKQLKISAASRHCIMELLIDSKHSRHLLRSQNEQSSTRETRIEIIRTEPRTTPALSGYGADCETERATKPHRSNPRKAPSMQNLHIPTQHRKLARPSITFATRTTSKQQRFRGIMEDHQAVVRSSDVLNRPGHWKAGTGHCSQRKDKCVETTRKAPPGYEISSKSTVAFPPRASSRQQAFKPMTADLLRLEATAQSSEIRFSHGELKASPTPPRNGGAMIAKYNRPTKGPQITPESQETLAQSVPLATAVATPLPSAKLLPIPTPDARQVIASPPRPSSAASELPAGGKPTQPARVDSGVSITQEGATKVLPMLNRSKTTLDSSNPKPKRQSGDELASWMAISSMLDRI